MAKGEFFMKSRYIYVLLMFVIFFGFLSITAIVSERDAGKIREGVLRFHVIANSDSETDQNNKMAVRDGIADVCSELFLTSTDKQSAMQIAQNEKESIINAARKVLQERGSDDSVNVNVRKRFFPTRRYEGVSLPAGVYDTIDVTIGEANGKNFWCVMFPDICLNASGRAINKQKMSGVLTADALDMVTESDRADVKFKFKTVELIENVKQLFRRKKV